MTLQMLLIIVFNTVRSLSLEIEILDPTFGNIYSEYRPRALLLEYRRLEEVCSTIGGRACLVLSSVDPFSKEIHDRCRETGVVKSISINNNINRKLMMCAQFFPGSSIRINFRSCNDGI